MFVEGDYAAAVVRLRQAVTLSDTSIAARVYLVRAHLRLGQHDDALQTIHPAILLDPARPSLRDMLGNIYAARYTARAYKEDQLADGLSAISAYRESIVLDSTRAAPHYNMGIMYG